MKIRKEDVKVANIASKRSYHPSIMCVSFEPGFLVATDGRMLIRREVEMEEDEEIFEPFLMKAKDFKELVPKGGFLRSKEKGELEFQHALQKRGQLEPIDVICRLPKEDEKKLPRPYPKYARAIPKKEREGQTTAHLDRKLFVELMKSFDGCDDVTISICSKDDAIRFDGKTKDGRKIVGVLMPKIEH